MEGSSNSVDAHVLPVGGILVCDRDGLIRFSSGSGFDRFNQVKPMPGRLAELDFNSLRGPVDRAFQAALGGRTSSLDLDFGDVSGVLELSPVFEHDDVTGVLLVIRNMKESSSRRGMTGFRREESEALFLAAFDRAPFGISVTDLEMNWLRVNDAYCEMLGYSRAEITEMNVDDFTYPPDRTVGLEWRRQASRSKGESFDGEIRCVRKDGEVIWVRVTAHLVPDESGEPAFTVAMIQDVTGTRALEIELHDRLNVTETIQSAIAGNRLELYGQPVIDLLTGDVMQHELLVRMHDADDPSQMIPPAEFLPAAEEYGIVPIIDNWVVRDALRIAQRTKVGINVSGITISDPAHVKEIEKMIVLSGARPQDVTFEITETAVARDFESAKLFANRLRELGCSFALDDFGVGFGTFTYLKHLEVDYLKIDIEFVRDLLNNEADRQVVRAMVLAARLFSIKTIAEGVENEETLDLLRSMNVDYAQGYWIGRPAPIADHLKTLNTKGPS